MSPVRPARWRPLRHAKIRENEMGHRLTAVLDTMCTIVIMPVVALLPRVAALCIVDPRPKGCGRHRASLHAPLGGFSASPLPTGQIHRASELATQSIAPSDRHARSRGEHRSQGDGFARRGPWEIPGPDSNSRVFTHGSPGGDAFRVAIEPGIVMAKRLFHEAAKGRRRHAWPIEDVHGGRGKIGRADGGNGQDECRCGGGAWTS